MYTKVIKNDKEYPIVMISGYFYHIKIGNHILKLSKSDARRLESEGIIKLCWDTLKLIINGLIH